MVRYKPDPEGVLLALSTLNSDAENSVVIGEAVQGVSAVTSTSGLGDESVICAANVAVT